jgi:hypothetical protein
MTMIFKVKSVQSCSAEVGKATVCELGRHIFNGSERVSIAVISTQIDYLLIDLYSPCLNEPGN